MDDNAEKHIARRAKPAERPISKTEIAIDPDAAGNKAHVASTPKAKRTWQRTPPPEHTPSTREWVDIARRVLIEDGIVEVKVDKLAKLAGVTRGGFYWRFKSRDELLEALVDDWRATNTEPMLQILAKPGTLRVRMQRLASLYILENNFSSGYDKAVRTWASLSPTVAQIVQDIDHVRIEAIRRIFEEAGHSGDEALVRARITYFHQVGYYATEIRESEARRKELQDIYLRVFTGLG